MKHSLYNNDDTTGNTTENTTGDMYDLNCATFSTIAQIS